MPIQKNVTRDNLVRTDGTTINIDKLDIEGDGLSENLGNANLKPKSVTTIKTTNQVNVTTLGETLGDTIVLIGQDTIGENGLYEKGATNSSKQTLDKNHYFFDTGGIRAIFIKEIDRIKQVYIDNIHIGEDFTTDFESVTPVDIFDIFVKSENITTIDLEVIGIKDDNIFHGTYKRTIYNNGTNYVDGGNHLDISKIKGTFVSPTISFDLDNKKCQLTPGDTDVTKWFIKGKKSM